MSINDFSRLAELGWKPLLQQPLSLDELQNDAIGRVVEVERSRYRVRTASGEHAAQLPGQLRHRADDSGALPTVGDWVTLDAAATLAMIRRVLPRFSELSRGDITGRGTPQLLCANVDAVLIVSSMNQEYKPRRLERYLTLARGAGVTPIVVLTKADLCDQPDSIVQDARKRLHCDDLIALDGLRDDARERLAPWLLAGDTLALLGSSGVGKSTLLNNLAGEPVQATQAVRGADDKGRHTTTRRSLFQLPGSVCVIDTPGMRELQIFDDDAVEVGFSDVLELAAGCRFSDCTHDGEPGCAVAAAMADGRLAADRWRSYQRLLAEQRQQARRAEAVHERRERNKAFAKMAKKAQRGKARSRKTEADY